MTAQDSATSVLEAPTGYKKPFPPKTSRKPQAIKTAVLAKRVQGQTKASIARDLSITPNCVTAIVEESGIDRHLESGRTAAARLIPEALRVVEVRLGKDSESAAFKLLEGIGVLGHETKGPSRGMSGDTILQQTIQNLILPASSKPEIGEDKAIVVEVVDNKE